MTQDELKIYNSAGAATVQGSRQDLARALRKAKKYKDTKTRYGELSLQRYIIWQCNFIGWPGRKRPNGRYI